MGQGWGAAMASCLNDQGAQAHETNETVGVCAQAGSQGHQQ